MVSILVILLVFVYSIPIRIDKEINAIEIKLDDPTYLETRTIQIKGSYNLNLFAEDRFKGQISITGYPMTLEDMVSITFQDLGLGLSVHIAA